MTASAFPVDVLVVGAGPVGLMAASQLARAGVSVRLVDAAHGPATTSRALGAHARSLEIYDQLGILGDVVTQSTRINAFIRHQGVHASRLDFDFGALKSPFPAMFNVDQVVIERVLRGHAAEAGVAVEWDTTLASFEQDDDGVTAELHHDGARHEIVRARYLWGCDGGHSTVRKALGLPLEGAPAHTWLIADAVVHTNVDRDGVHWLFQGGSTLMLFPFPEPGKWRLLDTTGEREVDEPRQIAHQFTRKLSEALGRETVVEDPTWASKFTIQQRAVPVMHVGRCFVSGDAAHVHSPASGQGLNTGVQDAFNLAWKLAMVIHGQADASLLHTYDTERVPVGQALLASTGEIMGTVMVDPGGADQDGPGSEPAKPPQLIPTMSGLPIAYPDSPLTMVNEDGDGPRPGRRLLQISASDARSPGWTALRARLRVPGWHLLMFTGSGGRDSTAADRRSRPAWLDVVAVSRDRAADDSSTAVWDPEDLIATTLAADRDTWILVRPNGYVSARGTGTASFDAALLALPVR